MASTPASATVRASTAWAHGLPREIKATTNLTDLLLDEGGGIRSLDIRREDILKPKDIFLLHDLLSQQECTAIISECESIGFGKTHYPKLYRGNARLMTTDEGLAGALSDRIRDSVPNTVNENGEEWQFVGLNECFRFSKYVTGDIFQEHIDTFFKRNTDEKSMYTVNLYLNGHDEFEGGHTRFVNGKFGSVEHSVQPIAGMALVFRQPEEAEYWHDGELLRSGVKYLLRTDVMYMKRSALQARCKTQRVVGEKRTIADIDRHSTAVVADDPTETRPLVGTVLNCNADEETSLSTSKKGKF